MSYDLFLKRRDGSFDAESFLTYFRPRPWYKIDSRQIWYANEDSGVYFSIELSERPETTEHCPLALNVNFFRPSYFILEVEPEITGLVQHFDLIVFDPQTEGMGEGDYQKELLISGWNHGNEFAYSALVRDP